jgi:GNAT superfamily N-acetyltransferase
MTSTEAGPTTGPDEDRRAGVSIRPIRPDDAVRLLRLFDRLSPETRYRRFFSPVTKLSRRTLAYLVDVDHDAREAIVAVVGDEVIGVARYDRTRHDPAVAEVAVVVEDAWQRHGVARQLFRELGGVAISRGIVRFTADVLPSNDAPVKLARTVAPLVEASFVDGDTHLEMPLRRRRPAGGPPSRHDVTGERQAHA